MRRVVAPGVTVVAFDGAGIGGNANQIEAAEMLCRDRAMGLAGRMDAECATGRQQVTLKAARIGGRCRLR